MQFSPFCWVDVCLPEKAGNWMATKDRLTELSCTPVHNQERIKKPKASFTVKQRKEMLEGVEKKDR